MIRPRDVISTSRSNDTLRSGIALRSTSGAGPWPRYEILHTMTFVWLLIWSRILNIIMNYTWVTLSCT
jgi:hypothetical protein